MMSNGLKLLNKKIEDIQPLGNLVLLQAIDHSKTSAGGLALPDIYKPTQPRFKVLKVGPGRITESGVRCEMEVKPGDVVVFGGNGAGLELEGRDGLLLCEHAQIMGIITRKAD